MGRNHKNKLQLSNTKEAKISQRSTLFSHLKRLKNLDILIISASFILLVPVLTAHRVADFIIFCIAVMSFDLIYGYMGRLSFGHMLYFGAGAYWTGLFLKYVYPDPFIAIFIGIIGTVLIAMILGLVVVKQSGAGFALLNMALNQIGFFMVMSPLRKITLGEDGFGFTVSSYGYIDFGNPIFRFIFVLLGLILVLIFLKKITNSPYGISIRSIKENENRVKFLGYNTFYLKWLTFSLSAAIMGFAGALSALNYNYVAPNFLSGMSNIGVIFACLIGGAGSLYGAIIGGVVYMFISNFLAIYTNRWELFLGISLLIIVYRFRMGIWGSAKMFITKRMLNY